MIKERDEQGRIRKGGLSSEKATELANRRWAKARQDTLTELLQAYGYESVEATPPDVRELASKALSSKSGSVSALIQLMKLKPRASVEGVRWDPQAGPCPVCGHIGPGVIDVEFARGIVALAREDKKHPGIWGKCIDEFLNRLQDIGTGEHAETQ